MTLTFNLIKKKNVETTLSSQKIQNGIYVYQFYIKNN